MRCLGIPNTAHFANVTQIEDAMALWEKLRGQKSDEAWKPEQVSCNPYPFNNRNAPGGSVTIFCNFIVNTDKFAKCYTRELNLKTEI